MALEESGTYVYFYETPMNRFLNKLNPAQQSAVLHKTGPLLVLAGAGSGKTTTMATRIAYLIAKHQIRAENILGLSFTRKAAGELKERVTKMVAQTSGADAAKGLTLSTFHALCVRILRAHGSAIGYSPTFTILAENDQVSVFKSILKQIKIDDRKFDVDTIRFHIGQAKNKFLNPEQAREYFLSGNIMPEDYAIVTCSVYEHYQDRLLTLNSLDFDDLLFQAVRLLETSKQARDYYNSKFRYVLVDEYQDTNMSQFRLLKLLTEKSQNICVVGDDDQSIYAWRGADPSHILQFGHHYPGSQTITLDQNYRSTASILDAANQVIAQNKVRHPKKLWSDKGQGEPIIQIIVEEDRAEVEAVSEEILRRAQDPNKPRPWSDFAILYRSNPQSRLFEEALRMKRIPYNIVGTLSYLERTEVKDALSYWRVIQNPKDDASLRRIINWPTRGIGKSTVDQLHNWAMVNEKSMFDAIEHVETIESLTPKARASVKAFYDLILRISADLKATPLESAALSDWGKRSFQILNLRKIIFDEEEDPKIAEKKWENIDELTNALGQTEIDASIPGISPELVLSDFLQRMTLDPKDDEKEEDLNKNQVTLLTLHGSKGLEFPVVFLVGVEEGFLPHRRTIEEAKDFSEERRLCYVGITRAKEQLILTRARTRIRYGKPVPRYPSRFLADIPENLMLIQNESLAPELGSKEQQVAHETKIKDFMASLRNKITEK
jgi:superfamily I DNA/RNA helicase